jgi:hypothetical protein
MNTNWRSMVTAMSLGALVASSFLASGCVVRTRAKVTATAEPIYVVDEAPPPPREERVEVRTGYVFVRGYWVNRGGQWEWRAGHWERARAGYEWQPAHWERRGHRYHWVEGRWATAGTVRVRHAEPAQPEPAPGPAVRDHRSKPEPAPAPVVRDHRSKPEPAPGPKVRDHRGKAEVKAYPVEPPPAPQPEKVEARKGYVWVAGHYRWEGGGYRWVKGHWERARAKQVWRAGRWERQGDRYIWIEGEWVRQ